jgi:hypothetical protein
MGRATTLANLAFAVAAVPGPALAAFTPPVFALATQGGVSSGTIADLLAVDGQALVLDKCAGSTNAPFVGQLEIRGFYTGGGGPTSFSVLTTCRSNTPGQFHLRIEGYDFASNQWVVYSQHAMPQVYSSFQAFALNPADFVGPFGLVVARLTVFRAGPSLSLCPTFSFDRAGWDIAP